VRVVDDRGNWLMLEDRIKQLKSEPRYSTLFPLPEGKVAKGNIEQLSHNFDAIAAGKVEVQ
jgi:hypothetical protein